jgi:serine protease AprX
MENDSMYNSRTPRPEGGSWHRPDGGSWHSATPVAVHGGSWISMNQTLTAVAAFLLVLASFAVPAAAGRPIKGDKGGGGVAFCYDLNGQTTTLHDVNVAIGADGYHKPKGKTAPIMGAGIDVAVIDTGVNTGAVNDLIDGPDLSFDALEDTLRHRDIHGHGTNMAGIIATNTATEWGVAPGSRIVNVKVGAGNGAVDVSQVIAAIDWAVENRNANGMNIRVINLAYDTDADTDYRTDPLSHAVENAWNNGIVVVAAGGNDGRNVQRLGNPAINPFIIAVGAAEQDSGSTEGWRVPSWSSKSDGVRNLDLVAPGASILSTGITGSYLAENYPSAFCLDGDNQPGLRGSGTSQAAGVVSGAVAMLLEQRPSLTPDQVKHLLTSTAITLTNDQGAPRPVEQQGNGMLDLAAALEAPTPGIEAIQTHTPAVGGGSLQAARGNVTIGTEGDYLEGEMTAFGSTFNSTTHALAETTGNTWSGNTWSGGSWSGNTWSGNTWSGGSWSGGSWSGGSWSGGSWSSGSWSGGSWSGGSWSGGSWSGGSWSGGSWA